jgi:phage terminase small subunit
MAISSELALNEHGLTPREEVFCQLVATGRTLHEASRTAGYSGFNFTEQSKRTAIKERIQALVSERLEVAGVTADRTKHELARIAYFDIRRLFDESGNLKPIHMLDDDTAAGVAQITVEVKRDPRRRGSAEDDEPIETTVVKIKAAPKMEALNLLSKHFKIVGEADEGVNALANALADRLNTAKRRVHAEPIEDAVEVPRRAVVYMEPEKRDMSEERDGFSDKRELDEDLF